jgi:hypothetical protein
VLVERIIADRWHGPQCDEVVIQNPTEQDFIRTLDALDGLERTLLCLEASNGRQLVIGGGDGNYVVYAAFSEHEFWNLLADISESRTIMVVAGGQKGDFAARRVVDRMRARKAGISFMHEGELDQSLRWERQEQRK